MEEIINMVSETYVECLVKKKPSFMRNFVKTLLIMLTVCFVFIGIPFPVAFLIAIVTGVGAYFSYMNADVEYEYLYLDKEVSIDKIMAKSKRKKVDVYDMERMEIIAPINSHQLDSYKNRTMKKTLDFSSGVVDNPDRRYVMIYDGGVKVIWEPNAEMLKAIRLVAPRKVFTD